MDQGTSNPNPKYCHTSCETISHTQPTHTEANARSVYITLTPLNGNFHPSERILNLNPDRTTIQVGRASKSPSKGLVGASDNAWFDSPVMSRDHAKLIFNPKNNVR